VPPQTLFGVRYPKLLCGRSSLYSIFHAAIFRRASNKFWNQLTVKHSSRNRPWKLSTCAFCVGWASPAPTPPAACVAAHPSAYSVSDSSIPPSSSGRTHAAG
jgi:hypothetical protein